MELNIDHDGVEYQLVSQTNHRDIQPERKTSKEDVEAYQCLSKLESE